MVYPAGPTVGGRHRAYPCGRGRRESGVGPPCAVACSGLQALHHFTWPRIVGGRWHTLTVHGHGDEACTHSSNPNCQDTNVRHGPAFLPILVHPFTASLSGTHFNRCQPGAPAHSSDTVATYTQIFFSTVRPGQRVDGPDPWTGTPLARPCKLHAWGTLVY